MAPITVGVRGTDQRLLQSFRRNSERTQTSVERLSTGKRINRPSDDPAGFIAAEGFRRDLDDLKLKLRAIASERQQSHVRQSGLPEIQTALNDLRGRVLSTADGSITADERAALEYEINEAGKAIDRIAEFTSNSDVVSIDFAIELASFAADGAGSEYVDQKADDVAMQRAALAAHEHTHLDVFERLYQDQIVITTEALSQVEDTDFAAETASLAQSQVLSEAAMAALSYSNRQRVDQLALLLDEIA